MSNGGLINHAKRTISGAGFGRSGILQILAWPVMCLILAMGLWYWTISKIDAEKRACEKKVLEEATALCKDYAQYLAHAIEQANQITLQLQYGWEKSHGNFQLRELSEGGIFRNPRIVNVMVVNREGMPATTILDNPRKLSYTDRDYFVYHKNDDSKTLLIGKPLVSRMAGKPAIVFSRRLNTPQGAFDGVALVAYDPLYLTAFYAGSFPGKTGLLMVAGLDGTVRSATIGNATQEPMFAALRAVPLFNSPEGASYLSGEQWFGDKLSRYVAWKTLEDYPLVAMVGLSAQEYFAPYHKTWATDRAVAISGSIILFLFALAAAGMSTRLVRKKHQEEEVRKAYRIATEGGSEGYYMYEALHDKSGAIVDFVLVDCNERGAEFYGIPQMQLLQKKLSSLYTAAYFDELMSIFREAMASGFYEDETRSPRESKLQIEWAKRRIVRSGNGLAVTVRDISERKRDEEALHLQTVKLKKEVAERQAAQENLQKQALLLENEIEERRKAQYELKKMNEELEQRVAERTAELSLAKGRAETANRAKSVFLANMSHELRTPLNAVLGFAQLIRGAPDTPRQQLNSLDIITRSGEHLLNLINNILDISRIESGRVLLEESATDLHQLLQEMRSLMYVKANEKGLSFTVGQSPDFPRNVNADASKLRQVLINLIGNAIKFTKTGGVILQARVAQWETPQSARVRFEVKDSGPGIRAEDMERIFLPFEQLANQPAEEAGSGLGLTICRQYIELMGGQLGVTSEPGTGSVFYFEIPVALLPVAEMPVEPRNGRVIGLEEGQPRYRILIAEDQPENRLLLGKLLEPLGFALREAENGEKAVAVCQEWRPDLVFMDIRMPVMDGLKATRRIKSADAGGRVKIVAVTAHALEEERREILESGCDDFIRKPYRESEILDALTKNIGARFVYEDKPAAAPALAELDAAALAGLPEALLNGLEQALSRIDIDAVGRVIKEIRAHDPALSDALAPVARDLQFGRILRLVRDVHGKNKIEDGT